MWPACAEQGRSYDSNKQNKQNIMHRSNDSKGFSKQICSKTTLRQPQQENDIVYLAGFPDT